jgi:hypothetical protein
MSAAVLVAAALGLGLFYYLSRAGCTSPSARRPGLALYASLFVVVGKAQFPSAPDWSRPGRFPAAGGLLPRRRLVAAGGAAPHHAAAGGANLDHIAQTARWLLFAVAIGVVCFVLPDQPARPRAAGGGAALGHGGDRGDGRACRAGRDALLVDVALIIDEIAGASGRSRCPATAFLMIYSLLVVSFASAYRIADALSNGALFHNSDGPARLSYSDALHFSVATLSTVGYGDIRPQDDGVRVLASLQVVAGQLLLLFGVAEILRSRRVRSVTEAAENPDDGEDDAVEEGHDGAPEPQKFRRNPASTSQSSE